MDCKGRLHSHPPLRSSDMLGQDIRRMSQEPIWDLENVAPCTGGEVGLPWHTPGTLNAGLVSSREHSC